jgi:hypothetical protein
VPNADPLFTKDAINVGGHKIPLALVGAVAAVAGVIVVWRARSTHSNVASVGAAPNPGGYDPNAQPVNFAPDPSAALSNISTQLGALTSSLNSGPSAAASSTAPASGTASQSFTTPTGPQGLFAQLNWDTSGNNANPIALQPSPFTTGGPNLGYGLSLPILGAPQWGQQNAWWIPVGSPSGGVGFVQSTQIRGVANSSNPYQAGAPVSSLSQFVTPSTGLTPTHPI